MEDYKSFSQLFAEAESAEVRKAAAWLAAKRQERASIELGSAARKHWREIRKALLEEGVAEDLVDGAAADFLSIFAASGRGK